mgnify:CR=1 FL=1
MSIFRIICFVNDIDIYDLVSDLFFAQSVVFFEKLNFYFMKTANISVYGI